jgi:hypothetical protein
MSLCGEENSSLYNIKLLFVFGIPSSALKNNRVKIKSEQDKYHDMIIPGKIYTFLSLPHYSIKV